MANPTQCATASEKASVGMTLTIGMSSLSPPRGPPYAKTKARQNDKTMRHHPMHKRKREARGDGRSQTHTMHSRKREG